MLRRERYLRTHAERPFHQVNLMSNSTGGGAFYNKVAARFGGYHVAEGSPASNRFPHGNPEVAFETLVRNLAGARALGLDAGCADGRHTFELAPVFAHLTGIDVSEGMLEAAQRRKAELGITNVGFEAADAERTGYASECFDLLYSRRGPTFYQEFARLLKPGGHYVEIQIGDRDARELKQIFGRGQDYGAWDDSFLERNVTELRDVGLDVIEAREYVYDDYFRDIDHLSFFLEGVPIFTDYDAAADAAYLQRYAAEHIGPYGVALERHRVLIGARKATSE